MSQTKPFNFYKTSDNNLVLEVGIAGFAADEVTVKKSGSEIIISGQKINKPDCEVTEVYSRGLSYRNFSDHFAIGPKWAVSKAEWVNGVLKITFDEVIEDIPVTIAVRKETA